MLKKNQKLIAIGVAIAFLSLLQASTSPLLAGPAPDQAKVAAANPEQAPSFVEEEGETSYPAKKKSIVPIILIGVGVAVAAAILFLVVLKTKYDIVGQWTVHITYDNAPDVWNPVVTFTGDKKTGTTVDNYGGHGTYTVSGKEVTFTLAWNNGNTSTFTGTFSEKDKMSGRFNETNGFYGPWSAVRGASATSLPPAMMMGSNRGPGK